MERRDSERRLAAILHADAVGYSRLMGEDDYGTWETLSEYQGIIGRLVEQHNGHVVDMAGDSVLADFASAINAVESAIAIQSELQRKNAERSDLTRMDFRIGVHLGEVIVGKKSIFGDGVNIAARLQAIADPGGICISGSINEQVRNRISLNCEYLGEQQLKNIPGTVRAYRILVGSDVESKTAHAYAGGTHYVMSGGMSVAVLPFTNLTGDPKQEYFSDGITEDIITDLSKFRGLSVIARNSSFTYKGKAVNVQQVGRELGVRYVLEGSVRHANNNVRITAQLADASKGYQIWSQRYDREMRNIFEVQDDVTQELVNALAVNIEDAERISALHAKPVHLEAYRFLLRGQDLFFRYTRQTNAQARRMYEKAIELDPEYARAYAALSRTYNHDWRYSWTASPDEALDKALALAQKSVELDELDARGHSELGFVYLYKKQLDRAIAEYEKALSLNPNDADVMSDMADAVLYDGRPAEAVELIRKAMRLNPHYPDNYLWHLADAYYAMRRYEDVIVSLNKMRNLDQAHRLLAASYGQLGMKDEAAAHAAEVLRLQPDFSVEDWGNKQPERHSEEIEHFKEGLRKAGLK